MRSGLLVYVLYLFYARLFAVNPSYGKIQHMV